MKKLVLFAAALLSTVAYAAEMSAEFKAHLDTTCAKSAKEDPATVCEGIANVVWFQTVMNPKMNAQAKKNPEIGNAAVPYCAAVCEAARKKK